jgi:sarcosine oxidase, subunit beta
MSLPVPHYDVVIIGAGSIGAPAAFYLAQAGCKVMVVDSVPSVGQGSNKKAIGGIRATHSDPAKVRLCLRSIEIFKTWKEIYGDEIEWVQGGYCFVAYRDQEEQALKEVAARQRGLGLNINWLDRLELLGLVPDLNPRDLLGGTFSPEDGNASPLLATHAFYTQAHRLGAQFRFNEHVTEILTRSGRVRGLKTDRATYGADVIINSAGAWASDIGQLIGINIPVKPDSHESAITESVAHFFKPMIVDIRPAPGSSNFYFYQHYTGQIVFCITPSPQIWGFDQRETSNFLPMVARRMIEVMPRLKNIRVRRTWRGLYPMTPDGNPIIGWSKELEGFLLAVGMCGQGFMLGPGVGELLARVISHQLAPGDEEVLKILSPDRQFAGMEMLK